MIAPAARARGGAWIVVTLALAVVASGLGNAFAYDDVALLVNDSRLHSLATLPARLTESWWPAGLFRPVSLAWLAGQWIVGAGAPLIFRLTSTLLYAAVCWAVYRLARQAGAPAAAALAGAALFAVHPVHAEVTANVVGQAELLSALFAVLAVGWYILARQSPRFRRRDMLAVTGFFLLSVHAKEGGYVVPGLLLAAELLLVRDPRPLRDKWGALREPALLMTAAFLSALWLRQSVLGGLGGEEPHIALRDLSMLERGVAMLAVVPEWARLLVWPARLQAEYGPPGLPMVPAFGPTHLMGLAIVVVVAWVIMGTWRRHSLVAFGLCWTVIALAPVANLIFPTGVLLAERTLFLPSAGLALAVAGLASAWAGGLDGRQAVRRAALAALAGLLLVGGVHSARRQPVWRDSLTMLEQTVRDAPESYRAQFNLGRELAVAGRTSEAETAYRRAGALWDRDARPFEELGQLLRARGECAAAIPVLAAGVRADTTSDFARSRLVECLIVEQRWDEAEREIAQGLAQGVGGYRWALQRVKDGRLATP